MRKRVIKLVWLVIGILLFTGCSREERSESSSDYIYYVNVDGTGLVREEYSIGMDNTEDEITKMLHALKEEANSKDYVSAFPKEVDIDNWELKDSDLDIDFNESYHNMDIAEELLLRAATVQSLNQINGVDYIKFTVGGNELTDREGKEIGYMSRDSFVDNTGSALHSYQDGNIKLFFANEAGDKLIPKEISIRYNSNKSVEKLIVEQLLKGPAMEGAYPTMPPQTKLLGVAVRDRICYINLDEGFLAASYNITPQIAVYSLVNSITETGGISQVQILINGETDVLYQESISLKEPFERNLEIVEEEKKD